MIVFGSSLKRACTHFVARAAFFFQTLRRLASCLQPFVSLASIEFGAGGAQSPVTRFICVMPTDICNVRHGFNFSFSVS